MITDYVYITTDQFKELREQFSNLWRNEPLGLNAFINSGEFALKHFIVVIFTKECLDFRLDYNYVEKGEETFLSIMDKQHGYEGQISNFKVITDNFSAHKGEISQDIVISYKDQRHKDILVEGTRQSKSVRTPQNWISDLSILFYALNITIMNLPHKIKERKEKATTTVEQKKKGRKTYKSVVYLKTIYELDPKFKITKSDLHHIIKCPAWGVRGHKRHYKNGMVVYIKPYIKGKYRHDGTKYVAKTYKKSI